MKKTLPVFVFALGVAIAGYCQEPQLLVSAAASLTDVLTALQPQAEAAIGGKVSFNFGGSGTLRRQIEEGAPVDVFFSAAATDMDTLEQKGLIVSATRHDALSNSLVLVGGEGTGPVAGIAEVRALLSKAEFLAIGNPDSVPAGRYAREALSTYGLFSLVERKLVLGGSVREVLQYVENGAAPLGIVFLTDALSVKPGSPVRQLFLFPADAVKTPIVYPVAVVSASKRRDIAERIVAFLQGEAAKRAFRAAGFVVK